MSQTPNDPLRDRLLGRIPQPADIAAYKTSVSQMLDQNQKSIKRERISVNAFWIFCAASATAWLWFSSGPAQLPKVPFLACIFLIWGGVEMVKHHINRTRVELELSRERDAHNLAAEHRHDLTIERESWFGYYDPGALSDGYH